VPDFEFRPRHATFAAMFTGIITDIGELVTRTGGTFGIRSRYPP
jgi:hypothetical protein